MNICRNMLPIKLHSYFIVKLDKNTNIIAI